jgi:hypothetical protein
MRCVTNGNPSDLLFGVPALDALGDREAQQQRRVRALAARAAVAQRRGLPTGLSAAVCVTAALAAVAPRRGRRGTRAQAQAFTQAHAWKRPHARTHTRTGARMNARMNAHAPRHTQRTRALTHNTNA